MVDRGGRRGVARLTEAADRVTHGGDVGCGGTLTPPVILHVCKSARARQVLLALVSQYQCSGLWFSGTSCSLCRDYSELLSVSRLFWVRWGGVRAWYWLDYFCVSMRDGAIGKSVNAVFLSGC